MKSLNFRCVTRAKRIHERAVSLWEIAIVFGILVLLAVFILYSCQKGASSSAGSLLGSATVSAAREAINIAGKNINIHMSPILDCSKAGEIASDVAKAQTKINAAAAAYPGEYTSNKDSIQRDVDTINQAIRAYNHDCGTSIPEITLPK